MSSVGPLVCGPVSVTWQADGHVDTITYEGKVLGEVVKARLQSLQLGPLGIALTDEQTDLISNLLNSVALLPSTEIRSKIFLADRIFEHLMFEMVPPNPKVQSMFWRAILDHVWRWEDSHEKVHKGTAYYFMAKSYLGSGDVPSAYTCFFNALEDDKKNFPHIPKNLKDAPAYCTTSLACNPNNALFLSVVVPLRAVLQSFIERYNSETGRSLTLLTIDQRFLQADQFEEIKRFFVATFHEIYHLAPLNSTRMINNDYSKLKVIDTLFNICLAIDQILEYRFLHTAPKEEKKMGNAVYHLALHLGWTNPQSSKDPSEFFKKAKPHPNQGSPDSVLSHFLDGTCTCDSAPMDCRMRAILAAYHLRNYGGHHVEGNDILVNRYDEVLKMIMHALFVSIEAL